MSMERTEREFYLQPTLKIASELLGKLIVHETDEGMCAGMIVETEANIGPDDDGAHSYGGRRTERTEIQYGIGGHAYVFPIYGMYNCFNVVTGPENKPEVVLVRALEPVSGIEIMKARRGKDRPEDLCSGPGKLCDALKITRAEYGLDLCRSNLRIENYRSFEDSEISVSPRINIDYAEKCRDYPWRFFVSGNKNVSRVNRRFKTVGTLKELKESGVISYE